MAAQLNIFLLLFGGLQGLLFCLFLFRKKLSQTGYFFLWLYLGVMLLQLTLKVMNKMWLMSNWSFLYSLSHYLPLLYGPLAYLFVKDVVQRRHNHSKVVVHFLPFIFIIIAMLLPQTGVTPNPIGYILYNPHTRLAILTATLVIYHGLAFQTWKKYRLSLPGYFSDTSRFQMNWLRSFILMSFTVCGLVVAALYLLYINYPSGHQYRYGFTGLTIFIYWISYTALRQPAIFSVIKGHAEIINGHIPALIVHKKAKKYAGSTLDANEKKRICQALELVIKNEKIYLEAELTIDRLAKKLACSRHTLSQVLNECMQQSFYEYINHYRVEEAKMLLTDEGRKDHKISSIGYDAGFNSLSTFNDVFKKLSGQTPSMYKKQMPQVTQKERV